LFIWVILWECGMFRKVTADLPEWMSTVFRLGLVAIVVLYLPGVMALVYDAWSAWMAKTGGAAPSERMQKLMARLRPYQDLSLTLGGAAAILTASLPFLENIAGQRWRRIWALTKLSFKEAVRSRVLYAFCGLLLLYLFATWYITPKHEDQVRTYVQVIYYVMDKVLIFAAAILASFSIPNDIRNQTIHTIVTKPAQRFEIILGRFLGLSALMSLVLVVMSAISLLYVVRGVDPDAAAESLKAREPLYGELRFENCSTEAGENVGKEWDYRRYITAPNQEAELRQAAIWGMPAVADSVAARKTVRCEYTFDIFRTTKGTENKGIFCNFTFEVPGRTGTPEEFKRRFEAAKQAGGKSDIDIENELAEELGIYVLLSQEVTNDHTQTLVIPAGILRAANKAAAQSAARADNKASVDPAKEPLQIRVTCNNRTQYVGMAKFDLYLRMDDPDGSDDRSRFALNFFKGASGLWMQLLLVIGVAVTLSTNFSGVISLLVTLMIYVSGFFKPFIASVAENSNPGGGPLESMYRLVRNENIVAPLEQTAAVKVVEYSDIAYRWVISRILDLIPDIDRFYLTSYVAEGFNIPVGLIAMNFFLVLAYVVPCAVVAFYWMKWREIAAPT
jgi:hypothetical protein